jgi:hypothetical protein
MDRFASGPARSTSVPERKETASEPTAPVAAPRTSRHDSPKRKRGGMKWVIGAAIALVVVVAAVWFFVFRGSAAAQIESGSYQAVFLTSGQVYFGKLVFVDEKYMKLTNVFYIQTSSSSDVQSGSSTSTDMQLIKLGNEIHGPKDSMIISRDQVLFFENLKDDGKVVQTIKGYKG